MAEPIREDILLLLQSRSDPSGIARMRAALKGLKGDVDAFNAGSQIRAGVDSRSADQAAKSTQKAAKSSESIRDNIKSSAVAARDIEKRFGVSLDRAKEIETVSRKGQRTRTDVFRGGGVEFSQTSTGRSRLTRDLTFRSPEAIAQAEAQAEALKQQQRIQAQAERLRARAIRNTRRFNEQQRREAQRAANQQKRIAQDRLVEQQRVARNRQAFSGLQSRGFRAGPTITTVDGGRIGQIRTAFNEATGQVAKFNEATGKTTVSQGRLQNSLKQTNQEIVDHRESVQQIIGKVLLWTIATTAIFGTLALLRGALGVFEEFEQGAVALERVGRGFGQTEAEVKSASQELSLEIRKLQVEFGQVGNEAQEAAVVFARLGLSARDTLEGVRVSLLAANVANISTAEAAKFLAATMQQFQLSIRDLPDILNKLNALENTTRVRTEDLLQAISRAGSVVREAGASFEDFNAIVATVAQATGRSGAEIGNAFKTIASRIANPRIQAKIFETTGIAVRNLEGDLKPLPQLLGELSVAFINLSEAERANLSAIIAGIRQRNILQTAIDNFAQVQAKTITQFEAEASAGKENALVMQTLSKRISVLGASFERLGISILNSGIGSVLEGIVNFIGRFADNIADLPGPVIFAFASIAAFLLGKFLVAQFAAVASFSRVSKSALEAAGSTGAYAGSTNAAVAANARLIASNNAVAASFNRSSAANATAATSGSAVSGLSRFGGAALRFAGIAGLVAGIVIALESLVEVIFDVEKASDRVSKTFAEINERANNAKALENRRVTLENMRDTLQKINAVRASGDDLTDRQRAVEVNILEILKEKFGIEEKGLSEVIALTDQRIKKAREVEDQEETTSRAATQRAIRNTRLELSNARERLNIAKRFEQRNPAVGFVRSIPFSDTIESGVADIFGRDPVGRVDERAKEVKKLEEALADLEERGLNQASKGVSDFNNDIQALRPDFDALFRGLERLDREREIVIDIQADSIRSANTSIDGISRQLQFLNDVIEQQRAFGFTDEDLKDVLSAAEELRGALGEAIDSRRVERFNREQDKLTSNLNRQLQIQELLSGLNADSDDPFSDLRAAERRVSFQRQLVNGLESELSRRQELGNISQDEQILFQNQIFERQKTLQQELADLDVTRVQALANMVERQREVTREIRDQRQATSESLAGLSDLELVRARVLAGEVGRSPLSQQEFLNLGETQRQSLSDFQRLFPGANLFDNIDLGLDDQAFLSSEFQINDATMDVANLVIAGNNIQPSVIERPSTITQEETSINVNGVQTNLSNLTAALSASMTQALQQSVDQVASTVRSNLRDHNEALNRANQFVPSE